MRAAIMRSATPIGGIAPRRHEQRHVVVRGRVGDSELDDHAIQKRRIGQLDDRVP